MPKPYLLVVTGRPGSGKTTLAVDLGNHLRMPVISRDQIKEGYVHTLGKKHSGLPADTNKVVTDIFFDTVHGLLCNNVSVIIEAAFQHNVWSVYLERFKGIAQMHLLICRLDDSVAQKRFSERSLKDPSREYFHGDDTGTGVYEEPRLDIPAIHVDTLGKYNPSVEELGKMILKYR